VFLRLLNKALKHGRLQDPLVRSSVSAGVEGGDLAYGRGDGREVLLEDRTVVAGDLRADFDVRVVGGHRIEAGAVPGPPVSVTARAVSSTGTMPVHFEVVGDVLFFAMCSTWSC
jgi:hypothetical protein